MNLGLLVLIVLVVMLLGGGSYGHFSGAAWGPSWGYGGIGLGTILLIVVAVLLLRG